MYDLSARRTGSFSLMIEKNNERAGVNGVKGETTGGAAKVIHDRRDPA